jgi:hypothetical protein
MVPKVIYMCYKDVSILKKYANNWLTLNPDYKLELYHDNRCKYFLLNEYSNLHYEIFNFITDGPIKADFWRVCILYKYGGLYVDADIEPLIPLKDYIEENVDFVTCLSYFFYDDTKKGQINPHFLMAHKGDEILKNCIDTYINYYINKKPYTYWGWSICYIIEIDNIKNKNSHVHYENNKKYQFLSETSLNDCEYNNIVVLHNRYNNYIDHEFC